MTDKVHPVVEATGDAILKELRGRKGFRHLLDEIEESDDGELLAEIRDAVAKAAARVLLSMEPTDRMETAFFEAHAASLTFFAPVSEFWPKMTAALREEMGV